MMAMRTRLLAVGFALFLAACSGGDAIAGGPVVTSTTASTTPGPVLPEAGGPCVDEDGHYIGQPGVGVQVRSGDQVVNGSFGYDLVGYCPGHPQHGNRTVTGDGFFANLAETLIQVEPGAELTLTAPAYPGATVELHWSIDNVPDSTFVATPTPSGEATWTVDAPSDAELYHLSVRLEWFEGEASYGVLVATRDLPPVGESLVSIEPAGDRETHPTVVPTGFVDCGTDDDTLRFCDPERAQRWIQIATQQGAPEPEWKWSPADRLPGVIQMNEGPPLYAIYVGPNTFVTVTASGVDHLDLTSVIGSIPAFDTTARGVECGFTPVEQLPDVWWKCDVAVWLPDPSEAGLAALVDLVGDVPIGYSFTPILPGSAGLTVNPIETYGPEQPWEQLDKWKEQMTSAAESMEIDPTPLADGTYLVEEVLLIYLPETPSDAYLALIDRFRNNGFGTETILRERYGHP